MLSFKIVAMEAVCAASIGLLLDNNRYITSLAVGDRDGF